MSELIAEEITDQVMVALTATKQAGDVDWKDVYAFISNEIGPELHKIVRAANRKFDVRISSNPIYRAILRPLRSELRKMFGARTRR